MLIDKNTGNISLDEGTITPFLQRHEFLASAFKNSASRLVKNEQYISYSITAHDLEGEKCYLTLYFDAETLSTVDIGYSMYPDNATWDDWSIDAEIETKQFHDSLLQKDLGSPHLKSRPSQPPSKKLPFDWYVGLSYSFRWGSVSSIYDDIASSSYIYLKYKHESPSGFRSALNRMLGRSK